MTRYNETPAGDDLRAALTGGLFFTQAPPNVSFPYGVFTWDGSNIDEIAGTRLNAIETASMTFSIYSENDDGGTEIFDIIEKFIEHFDWSTLTYPAGEYSHLAMHRISVTNRGKIERIWTIDLIYNVLFEH